ncbi:MAG TPA: hypothetical protein VFE36_16470 [Candidatus Baltobacteraceae bacterium]|jgi:hypothetical protein|nr:hypothetical protein [Candidatus Baltobacteraceae bacterium]
MAFLLVAHVLCTTIGYAGLIAGNVYLLFLTGSADAGAIASGLSAWRKTARTFGPLLLAGMLLGFALAGAVRVPLGAPWLLATYALIVAVIAVQATVMVPWQLHSDRSLAAGTIPRLAPVRAVLVALSIGYTAILTLMLVRPG